MAPDRVAAATRNINRLARSLKTNDETRTLDQLRADVYLDLLCGVTSTGRPGGVNINVELTTLVGLDDHAGDIPGLGPVTADLARKVAADQIDGEWTYVVTHNGNPVATGTTKRRPTASQQAHIRASYPACVFPGCRMPSTNCDIDHRKPWAEGGTTCNHNLGPVCRRHHITKDRGGWKLRRLPGGDHEFTSPLGHSYTTSGRSP